MCASHIHSGGGADFTPMESVKQKLSAAETKLSKKESKIEKTNQKIAELSGKIADKLVPLEGLKTTLTQKKQALNEVLVPFKKNVRRYAECKERE